MADDPNNLVTRLRARADDESTSDCEWPEAELLEAAGEIGRLTRERDDVRDVVKTLAAYVWQAAYYQQQTGGPLVGDLNWPQAVMDCEAALGQPLDEVFADDPLARAGLRLKK